MKIARITIPLLMVFLLIPLSASSVSAQVDPPEVNAELERGESMVVEKTVQTPEIPPKPDIYFLCDTTASMYPTIEEVADNANSIMAQISAEQPDAQFGVGNYRDFNPYDETGESYGFQNQLSITSVTGDVSAAISDWTAYGGGDGPEAQFYSMTQIANSGVGWRPDATKIVVWFGDAPAHDPVPAAATGLDYDITETTVNQTLVDAGIRVIAISTPHLWFYPDALDDDPTNGFGGDYEFFYGTTEDGAAGQASHIATATDGVHLTAATPDDIVAAILEGLSSLPITITQVIQDCEYLKFNFNPTSQTVTGGDIATFEETITVLPDAPLGETEVCTVEVIDEATGQIIGVQTVSIHIAGVNQPPIADANGPYASEEGSAITFNATSSHDPDGSITLFEWDWDNDGVYDESMISPTIDYTWDDDYTGMVSLRVTDDVGAMASDNAQVTVNNVAPTVGNIIACIDPVEVGTEISANAGFTDPGILDTHTAVWDWDDSNISEGSVSETNGTGIVSGSQPYATPGVYTIKLTVTDDDGGSGESFFQYIVVYDPTAGFVTGGGWIDSPAEAYTPDPSLTGKANFGFVSKYKKGQSIPSGQTQFQFQVASLNFHSTSYQWLIIAGAKAKFKGSGTINGEGDYGFMLTATDGQIAGGGDIDKFRIKIWNKLTDEVIYDNQLGDSEDAEATQAIGGGSIVIHAKK